MGFRSQVFVGPKFRVWGSSGRHLSDPRSSVVNKAHAFLIAVIRGKVLGRKL